MDYEDGTPVKIADRILMRSGGQGKVVINFETQEFLPPFEQKDWVDYQTGVMLEMENGALIKYDEPYYIFKGRTYWSFSLLERAPFQNI